MADKRYRDDKTGQWTTAADAANRPAETVAETVPTRHEAPDTQGRLGDLISAHLTIEFFEGQLLCACGFRLYHPKTGAGAGTIKQRGGQSIREAVHADHLARVIAKANGKSRHEAPDVAKLRRLAEACPKPGSDPHILGPWWDAGDLARSPVDVPADREFIMAASPTAVLALLDDAAALRAELAHMTEARDNARAEVERLSAVVRRVRELHRESNGSLSALYPDPICECGKDYPCPTVRALGAEDPK